MKNKSKYSSVIDPLISVIIPCYNHAKYLKNAISSILEQDSPSVEIIVVDDGSTDNTYEVSSKLDVKYIRQNNLGLSAARNKGIEHSKGEFLVFLDADDWLLPGALKKNFSYLITNPEAAFASGAHKKVYEIDGITINDSTTVEKDHYLRLLQGNYIGMHAAVMYRRWVFQDFMFDTSLKMCEDYDMYLKVARIYPVIHHRHKISAYRLHGKNMSDDIPKMLNAALYVLKRQKSYLNTNKEKKAYKKGIRSWNNYYTLKLYIGLQTNRKLLSFENIYFLLKYKPTLVIKLSIKKLVNQLNYTKN